MKNVGARRGIGLQQFPMERTGSQQLTTYGASRSGATTTYARKFVMDIANYDNNYNMYSRQQVNQSQSPRSPSYDTRARHMRRVNNLTNYTSVGTRRKSLSVPRSSAPASVGSNNQTLKLNDLNVTGERTRVGGISRLTGLNRESIDQTVISQPVGVSTEMRKIQTESSPQRNHKDKILVVSTATQPNSSTVSPPGAKQPLLC